MASEKKVFTLAEVKELAQDRNKCILVINNHVYDISKFIDEVGEKGFAKGKF